MAGKPPRSVSTTRLRTSVPPPVVSPDNDSYQRLKWERDQATQKALTLSEQLAEARQAIDELKSPIARSRPRLFRNFSDSNGGDRLSRSLHGILGGGNNNDEAPKSNANDKELAELRERVRALECENGSLIQALLQCKEDLVKRVQWLEEIQPAIQDQPDDLVDDVSVE